MKSVEACLACAAAFGCVAMHSVFFCDAVSAFAGDAMPDFALLCRLKDEDEDANVDGSSSSIRP